MPEGDYYVGGKESFQYFLYKKKPVDWKNYIYN